MDEMNGAFEEKKRRKGGKRLMQPEKAAAGEVKIACMLLRQRRLRTCMYF